MCKRCERACLRPTQSGLDAAHHPIPRKPPIWTSPNGEPQAKGSCPRERSWRPACSAFSHGSPSDGNDRRESLWCSTPAPRLSAISRVLRTISSLTALVAGWMPLLCGAATSEGAWPRACARSVSRVAACCGQSRCAYLGSRLCPRVPGPRQALDDRPLCERQGPSGGARALGRRVCAGERATPAVR